MTQFTESMLQEFMDRRWQLLAERDQIDAEVAKINEIIALLGGTPPIVDSQAKTNGNGKASKQGRPVGTGHRDKQVLAILTERGPLTMAQIAAQIGMPPNYLYRVGKRLEERHVVRNDKGTWSIA